MFGDQPDSPCWGALFLNSPPSGSARGCAWLSPRDQTIPKVGLVLLGPTGSLVGSRGTCARDFRLQNQQLVAAWQVVFLPDDLTSCPVWLNRWGDLLHKLQLAMVLASGPFCGHGDLCPVWLNRWGDLCISCSWLWFWPQGLFIGHGDLLVPLLE